MPKKKAAEIKESAPVEPVVEEAVEQEEMPPLDEGTPPTDAPVELREEEKVSPTEDTLGDDALLLGDTPGADSPPPAEDTAVQDGVGDDAMYQELLQEAGRTAPLDTAPSTLSADDVLAQGDLPEEPPYMPDPSGESPAADTGRNAGGAAESRTGTDQPPGEPDDYILTIDAHGRVETEEDRADFIWHEIRNSHIGHRILTGTLDAIERRPSGGLVAVINYKGYRVVIPVKEMMLSVHDRSYGQRRTDQTEWYEKTLSVMSGCEIDFIVRGVDNNTRSVVASRRAAMLRKRQTFYLTPTASGAPMIYPGRVVQARVVGVAEKVMRVELFGVECPMFARDISWSWVGDIRDSYSIGDHPLVRVRSIQANSPEDIQVAADIRSVSGMNRGDALAQCQVQSKYVGRVTDVRRGVVFVRLNNGANGIAHTCLDRRYPGKKDDVSFVITRIDRDQGIAIGIIPRIIKQNL